MISINWADLGKVAGVSLAFGAGLVIVFTLGVLGLTKAEAAREAPAGSTGRASGLALAGLAFAGCAAAVLYGLYLVIPQFHG